MKRTSHHLAGRASRTLLALVGTTGIVVGSLLCLVVGVGDVTAGMVADDPRPNLTIAKGAFSAGDLMAGDHLRQSVVASADIEAVLALTTSIGGSEQLASQIVVHITDAYSGESLYHGPLTGASFDGRLLSASEPQELVIDVHLPSSADAGLGGLTVNVAWNYTATRVTGS